jgi:hypothetical protein
LIARAAELYRTTSSERAVVALVAANLIPLVGVLLFGWSLHTILILYWIENGIVGFWNVPKMALAEGPVVEAPGGAATAAAAPLIGAGVVRAAMIPFFIFHYGMFWFVHGVFVFVLPSFGGRAASFGAIDWLAILIGAIALFISHGASFFTNFIGRGEFRTTSPARQMGAPYARVVVLHLTILFGAFAVALIGAPIAALLVMVVLKTGLDLALHLREHAGRQVAMTRSTNAP